jgi:uncharacterized integral membrane protein
VAIAADDQDDQVREKQAPDGVPVWQPHIDRGRTSTKDAPMIGRILRVIVMVPAFVALALLAVANQQMVTVSFDPFDTSDTDLTVAVPLWLLGFTILIAGVLLGGFAAWLRQGRHRRLGSRLAAENVVIRTELASLKGKAVGIDRRSTVPARRAS